MKVIQFPFFCILVPNQPSNVITQVISGSEVRVDWMAPFGNLDNYLLTLTGQGDPEIVTENGTTFTFLELLPGTQYTLKIESQSGGVYSKPVTSTFVTSKFSPCFKQYLIKLMQKWLYFMN